MRRELARSLRRVSKKRWTKPLGRIPGITIAYRAIERSVEPAVPGDPTTVEIDGYEILVDPQDNVGRQLYAYGEYEPAVTSIIREDLSPGDTAVDIGAHYGTHTATMHRATGGARGTGRVLAVEPHPEVRQRLERTVVTNGLGTVEVVGVAVGAEAGRVMLRAPDPAYPDRSRLAVPPDGDDTNTGADVTGSTDKDLGSDADADGDQVYEVEVVTLDTLFERRTIDSVALLKIDVEGHELAVLRGLGDRIHTVDSLLLEVHEQANSDHEIQELADRLESFSTFAVLDPDDPGDPTPVGSPADVTAVAGRILYCRR